MCLSRRIVEKHVELGQEKEVEEEIRDHGK